MQAWGCLWSCVLSSKVLVKKGQICEVRMIKLDKSLQITFNSSTLFLVFRIFHSLWRHFSAIHGNSWRVTDAQMIILWWNVLLRCITKGILVRSYRPSFYPLLHHDVGKLSSHSSLWPLMVFNHKPKHMYNSAALSWSFCSASHTWLSFNNYLRIPPSDMTGILW